MKGKQKKDSIQPTEVDWQKMKKQIDSALARINDTWEQSREEKNRILTERAKKLAKAPSKRMAEEKKIEIIEFSLAYETYAFESSFVREVMLLKDITNLPGTPEYVLGITNIRGEIVPVIDIKKFFNLPEKGLTDLNKLIILQTHDVIYGVLADSITGTRLVSTSEITSSLPTLIGIRANYLLGVTKGQIVILDAQKILSDDLMLPRK